MEFRSRMKIHTKKEGEKMDLEYLKTLERRRDEMIRDLW